MDGKPAVACLIYLTEMPTVSPNVEAFFAEFERAGNVVDLKSIEARYAPYFLSADPNGTQPVPRDALLAALPKRSEMFASVGGTAIHLTGIRETRLDANYVLVDSDWGMSVITGGEDINLSSTLCCETKVAISASCSTSITRMSPR
jgi:hypothetical protein